MFLVVFEDVSGFYKITQSDFFLVGIDVQAVDKLVNSGLLFVG